MNTFKVLQKLYPSPLPAQTSIGWLTAVVLAMSLQAWLTFPVQAKAFETSHQISTGQVQAQVLLFSPQGVAANHQQWVGLHLKHQPGWHTYWKNPGDTGLATHLQWSTPKGIRLGQTLWPLPQKIQIGELSNYGYEKETLLIAPLQIDAEQSIPENGADIKLHASWLVGRMNATLKRVTLTSRFQETKSQPMTPPCFNKSSTSNPFRFQKKKINSPLKKKI